MSEGPKGSRSQILIQIGLEGVGDRHFMPLSTLFLLQQPPPFALRPVALPPPLPGRFLASILPLKYTHMGNLFL
jgi:hypothetical protein